MARILLVEDDPAFAYTLARFLRAEGHEVVSYNGPIEALQELESDRRIDLLVTDVRLAEGMPHGFSLGRMAKLRRVNLPILFITGFPDIAKEDRTPPGPVIYKPFGLEEFGAAIASELAPAPAAQPPSR
ncbi:MAG: response regulator [Alphaproteobacteria bacterium]|nr:response regulator [Alphaproteobacteria bacterium]